MSKVTINPKFKDSLEALRDAMQEKAFASPFYSAEARQAAIYSGEYSTRIPITKHESVGLILVISAEDDETPLRWSACGCVVSNATNKAKRRLLWTNKEKSIVRQVLEFFLENLHDVAPGEFQKFERELHYYRNVSFEMLSEIGERPENIDTESTAVSANAI